MNLIIANLQRILFRSKKERFISEDQAQLLFSFEEFGSAEDLNDQTPVKEKISYEREKPTVVATRRFYSFISPSYFTRISLK
jgi:hypothetical protein